MLHNNEYSLVTYGLWLIIKCITFAKLFTIKII